MRPSIAWKVRGTATLRTPVGTTPTADDEEDALGGPYRCLRALACPPKHLLQMGEVLAADPHPLHHIFRVVRGLGETQAALIEVDDNRAGILQFLVGAEGEDGVDAEALQVRDLLGQPPRGRDHLDPSQLLLKRCPALALDRPLIEARRVVVADLPIGRGPPLIWGRRPLEDLPDPPLIDLPHLL